MAGFGSKWNCLSDQYGHHLPDDCGLCWRAIINHNQIWRTAIYTYWVCRCVPACVHACAQGWTRLFVFVCGNSSVTVLVRPVQNSRLLSLDALVEAEIWDEVVTKWRQEKHRPHLMLWAKGNKHANTHIVRHILLHRVNSSALALSDGPQCSHSE